MGAEEQVCLQEKGKEVQGVNWQDGWDVKWDRAKFLFLVVGVHASSIFFFFFWGDEYWKKYRLS